MKDMMKRYEEKHGQPMMPILIAGGVVVGLAVTMLIMRSRSR